MRASQSPPLAERHEARGNVFISASGLLSSADRDPAPGRRPSCLAESTRDACRAARRLGGDHAGDRGGAPPDRLPAAERSVDAPRPRRGLEFFNGLGGFSDDGREYVTVLGAGQWTPAPWINVIANPDFGFLVSESGAGYTWALNSRENQLTPWSNDPVGDPAGRGDLHPGRGHRRAWGPTALPIREDAGPTSARHGQGYSRFEHPPTASPSTWSSSSRSTTR